MKNVRAIALMLAFAIVMAQTVGCTRGHPSKNTPIHLVPDMDVQQKVLPQAENTFYADGGSMREPVPGTVARGHLDEDDAFNRGRDEDGTFVKDPPVYFTKQRLERGQERFNIYCSPCHSRIGDGTGIMVKRGYVPPPTFHSDRLRNIEAGYIFDVITHGIRNMPSYAHQIPPDDRWSIVGYVRVLQRSQNAKLGDVPVELRKDLK